MDKEPLPLWNVGLYKIRECLPLPMKYSMIYNIVLSVYNYKYQYKYR